MKKTFTRFLTALALFAFFIPSLTVMGGTKTEGFESATTSSTYNQTVTVNANESDCGIGWTIYYGTVSTQGPINGQSAQMRWYKSASTNYPYIQSTTAIDNLTNVAFKARVGHTDVKMNVHYSTNGTTWTALATDEVFADTYVKNFSYDIPSGGQYIKIGVSSNSTAPNGSYYSLLIDDVVFTYTGEINTYTVTYHANVTGTSDIEVEYNEGATVTIADNTFSNPGYTFTEWNTEANGSGDSYAPGDEIEDIDDNLELYAIWTENTQPAGDLIIDFESAVSAYTDWTFTNMTSQQTGSITAHAGTNYGTTGGKATASIVTNSKIATPYTLTCYVSKQSTNTTASTWYIQVSSDGSTWTDVETRSATDMTKGEWKEFTADLTDYTNVYVRVYYSGSTAVRNIDDLTLITTIPSVVAPTFDPADGATFGNEGLSVTIDCETPNTVIYYTVDGSTPDNNSTLYEGAIILTTTATIKAIAYDGTNYSSVATATYTYLDPNAPGTVNNPYTVAQARAAIDANTGITGVYAKGIVSAIPTAWNTQYNNITFNFVDEEGDNNFLQAFRCVSGENADASTVAVGDSVVVYGNLKKYNNTYEFDAACSLVSLIHPAVAVEAPTFSPVAGTYAEAQSVTISCESPSTIIYYTLDGTEPTPNSTLYSEAISVSSTTTIKAVAYAGGDDHSTVATANYYFCSDEDPYTVTEALAFAEYQYPANGIYVSGIVSTAPTQGLTNSGQLTYYISVDGVAENQLEVYKGLGLNEAAFTAQDDIQVGDIVTVYGNVVIYGTSNPIKEFAQGNYLVSFERPTPVVEDYDLTVEPFENLELITFVNDEMVMEEDGTVQVTNGSQVMLSIVADEGYVIATLMVNGVDHAADIDDEFTYTFEMPAEDVTISATAMEAPTPVTYNLATNIVSGMTYIISNGVDRAMGAQSGNIRSAAAITIDDNNVAYVTSADVYEFVITGSAEDGYTIYDVKDEGYLYASSSNSNVIGTRNENSDNNSMWTIDFDESAVTIYANGTNTRNHIRYNYNNGNDRFSCYAENSSLQSPLYLFVKDEAPVVETYVRTIEGYGEDETVQTGWNLIATPVQIDIAPNTMVSGNYDLFRFNQSADEEWENYKSEHSDFTTLEPGKGYLYAHDTQIDLSFTGTPYSGDGEIELTYNEDAPHFAGWNLIGNPFGEAAYLENNYPFYKMNTDGSGLITPGPNDDRRIKLMEGIFVQATDQIDKVTFVRSYDGKRGNSEIALNIIGSNNNVIDRAIVRLNEGYTLEKFTLNENDTKIYFPMEDADYAIVNSNGEGTMPVNFKAARTGKYTLSVETEGIDMNYLHIIDRLTGEDINVLLDNEYSFIASQSDVADRFILSFNENGFNAGANETFAFQNGNDVIVNGNGELQVFDVTGRMVMNTQVNGVQTINMPQGVYVFRLNENIQKMVVR